MFLAEFVGRENTLSILGDKKLAKSHYIFNGRNLSIMNICRNKTDQKTQTNKAARKTGVQLRLDISCNGTLGTQ